MNRLPRKTLRSLRTLTAQLRNTKRANCRVVQKTLMHMPYGKRSVTRC